MFPFFESAAATWWNWISAVSLQIAILTIPALIFDRILKNSRFPSLRASIWILLLMKCALPPGLVSPVGISTLLFGEGDAKFSKEASAPNETPAAALFLIWSAGVALFFVIFTFRTYQFRRAILQNARPIPAAAERSLKSACRALSLTSGPAAVAVEGRSPALLGWFRPILILPESLLRNDRGAKRELYHILLHECAHYKRRDAQVDFAARCLQFIFWFHPAVWIAGSRLRAVRELQCDALVARTLQFDTAEYQNTLIAGALKTQTATAGAALHFFNKKPAIFERLSFLQKASPRCRRADHFLSIAFCIFAACCILPMERSRGDAELQFARHVIAAAASGERQSCFQLQFAARILAARSDDDPAR